MEYKEANTKEVIQIIKDYDEKHKKLMKQLANVEGKIFITKKNK